MKAEISTFSPSSRKLAEGEKYNLNLPGKTGKIAVVGAGIMGVCSAYFLQNKGYNVTLFDKYGPGNSASSSGGESRLLRLIYGASEFYSNLTFNAIPLWLELQKNSDPFFIPSPVLWLSGEGNRQIVEQSFPFLDSKKVNYQIVSNDYLRKRWPFMSIPDVELAVIEELSGYLKARKACQAIAAKFVDSGGEILLSTVKPFNENGDELTQIETSGGKYACDFVIVATGPWLNQWLLQPVIEVTRQEVLYYALADATHMIDFPSWVDLSYESYYYGIPGDLTRGFKIACDSRGATFNPDKDSRIPDPASLEESRRFLKFRFPALAESPLLEYRVCQYSNTTDRNLILDLHPRLSNVLLIGGGSGHGFKYGPAIGKIVADFVSGETYLPAEMRFF